MNLELSGFGVVELNDAELVEIDGGGKVKDAIKIVGGIIVGAGMAYIIYD